MSTAHRGLRRALVTTRSRIFRPPECYHTEATSQPALFPKYGAPGGCYARSDPIRAGFSFVEAGRLMWRAGLLMAWALPR